MVGILAAGCVELREARPLRIARSANRARHSSSDKRSRRGRRAHRTRPSCCAVASATCSFRAGHSSRGRKLTIVSIMSIGAGSVGVSARPALPTTMSTSGNRQSTMSRAFKSSSDSVTDARGTVIGMSITIPSSSGAMNSRSSGFIDWSAIRATVTRLVGSTTAHTQFFARSAVAAIATNRIARVAGRLPSGTNPRRNVTPSTHASAAGWSIRYERTGPVDLDHTANQRVITLRAQFPANEDRAQGRHQRDRQDRHCPQRERLGVGHRVKHLPLDARPAQRRAGTKAP